MIYVKLFLTFLKIGAVSFGGGYGMIALLREELLAAGWLGEEEIINFIAVAESTPGPVAVNMATFTGAHAGGILGAVAATLGVALPSFVIILLIAAVLKKALKYAGVRAALDGITPAVAGLVTATAAILFLSGVLGIKTAGSGVMFDWRMLAILGITALIAAGWRLISKKSCPPVALIIFAGALGAAFYL